MDHALEARGEVEPAALIAAVRRNQCLVRVEILCPVVEEGAEIPRAQPGSSVDQRALVGSERLGVGLGRRRRQTDPVERKIAQSGMSWKVIEAKWDGFEEAFAGSDPETIAEFTEDDVDRLTQDTGIIRNRKKIEATLHNAETMLRLEADGGFVDWLRSFDSYEELVKAIRKEFKFMGPTGIYFWLYVTGEKVPDYHEVFGG